MYTKSKTLLSWVIFITFSCFLGTSHAYWHDADLAAELAEVKTVDAAVDLIAETLERDRFEIVLEVDHQAAATSVGLELRPTTVVFARASKWLERAILRRSDTIGIDLPVKILVFEDADGVIQYRFNPTGYLTDRHDVPTLDVAFRLLNRTVDKTIELNDGLITTPSNRSVADTVTAIQDALAAAGGFRIPLTLDYSVGFRHPRAATLIVFGNPNVGTPLMQATQEVALDLPQKFLVWEDEGGEVYITYNDPFFIAKRHNVQGEDARLTNISNALANFARLGAGE